MTEDTPTVEQSSMVQPTVTERLTVQHTANATQSNPLNAARYGGSHESIPIVMKSKVAADNFPIVRLAEADFNCLRVTSDGRVIDDATGHDITRVANLVLKHYTALVSALAGVRLKETPDDR